MFSKPEPNGTPDPIDGLENSRFEHENGEVKQSEGGEKDGRNLHRWQKLKCQRLYIIYRQNVLTVHSCINRPQSVSKN